MHRCVKKERRNKYPGQILQLFGVPLASIGGAGRRSLLRGPLGFRGLLFSSEQTSWGELLVTALWVGVLLIGCGDCGGGRSGPVDRSPAEGGRSVGRWVGCCVRFDWDVDSVSPIALARRIWYSVFVFGFCKDLSCRSRTLVLERR